MANINKIKLSGTTYSIQDLNATKTVELTQAQYDALVVKDPNTFYVITDAEGGDLSNYYTKTEVDSALSGKQDTLVSGTNIKTINNESILGSGNIDIQGGGKAVSAGTNISITTGETADTINCTLPISVHSNTTRGDILFGTDVGSLSDFKRLIIGRNVGTRANSGLGDSIGINIGDTSELYGSYSVGIGNGFKIGNGSQYGNFVSNCVAIGHGAKTRINNAVAIGKDTEASGTTKTNINNQLTIDTSNQVYIYNKDNTEMICLQDALGGGGSSYTAGDGIDITNDVISVTGKADTSAVTEAISAATSGKADSNNVYTKSEANALLAAKADTATTYTKTEVDSALSGKQDTLVAGTNIKTINNESILGSGNIDIQGGGKTIEGGRGISITTGETADTVSFSLPISAGTGTDSVVEGYSTIASGVNSHAEGLMTKAIGAYSHAEGSQTQAKSTCSHAEGLFTSAATPYSFACGLNGVASGDSLTVSNTNTIFAIGNGLDNTHRTTNPHNAFEVKLNGDIYIADTNDTSASQYYRKPMVKLQDTITATAANTTALGGLKLVKLTQAEYDALATKDSSTVYFING